MPPTVPAVVYAATDSAVGHGGVVVHVRIGEVWAADDPLVAARPDLFAPAPTRVRTTTDPAGVRSGTVEQATARPGERRAR